MGNVQKRPNGMYRARYRDAAHREHAHHFSRKIDARRWLDANEVALSRGEWVDPAQSRITVGEWSARWLAQQVQLKPSTRARYAGLLTRWVLPRWSGVSLAEVSHADVSAWVTEMVAAGLAPSTVRQAHRVFALLLGLAVRDGRLSRNPADRVSLPRAHRTEKRFLSHDQVVALADNAGPYQLVVLVLAYCGLRFGELAALRVRNVDLLRRRLEVVESVTEVGGELVFGTPKTHQHRSVPLPRSLVDELAECIAVKRPEDRVFCAPGGGVLRVNNFRSRVFDRAAVAAGVPGVTPHELRHTAASLAVAAGANVKAVQRMLGHASAAMTLDVYSGLFGDDLDAVADHLDQAAAAARESSSADCVRTGAPARVRDLRSASG